MLRFYVTVVLFLDTTRTKEDGEMNGIDYHFVNKVRSSVNSCLYRRLQVKYFNPISVGGGGASDASPCSFLVINILNVNQMM